MEERLQKIIAQAGISSRRAAETLIVGGRVRVNGRIVTELGAKADPRNDKIEVDGRRLVAEMPVYYLLHKPRGVVSTMSDPEGRPTVAELTKTLKERVFPVGRLDFATSGVLLMTNDGEFSATLLHPRKHVPKTYVLKVQGSMDQEDLDVWRHGVMLEDGVTLPAEVHLIRHEDDKTWFEVTLREGRNQQIRRMGDATGFRVMRLARTSFAGITHEGLRPGEMRPLTRDELLALRDSYGVPKRVRAANADTTPAPQGRRAPRRSEPRPTKPRAPRDRGEREREPRAETSAPARGPRPTTPRPTREREPRAETSAPARGPRPTTPRPTREREPRAETSAPARGPRPTTPRPTREREPRAETSAPARGPRERRSPAPTEARTRAPERAPAAVRAGRSDRSETTPRGAPKPASRARGRGDR